MRIKLVLLINWSFMTGGNSLEGGKPETALGDKRTALRQLEAFYSEAAI